MWHLKSKYSTNEAMCMQVCMCVYRESKNKNKEKQPQQKQNEYLKNKAKTKMRKSFPKPGRQVKSEKTILAQTMM